MGSSGTPSSCFETSCAATCFCNTFELLLRSSKYWLQHRFWTAAGLIHGRRIQNGLSVLPLHQARFMASSGFQLYDCRWSRSLFARHAAYTLRLQRQVTCNEEPMLLAMAWVGQSLLLTYRGRLSTTAAGLSMRTVLRRLSIIALPQSSSGHHALLVTAESAC